MGNADSSPHGESLDFHQVVEYTLSYLWLARPSLITHHHLLSEPSPFSAIRGWGAWLRIAHCFHLQRFYHTSGFSPEPVNVSTFTLVVEALGVSRNLAMSQEVRL